MNSCVLYILTAVILTSSLTFRSASSNVCTRESCFPRTWDLETVRGASVTANSTCGLRGSEEFCVKQQCGYQCNNALPSDFHGANLTIDTVNDDSYWKSKNLDENVVLELSLGHSYFFVEITATFFVKYPAAMYFSKSDDYGATWQTLAYFSSECGKNFNMTAVEENDRDGFLVQCFRLDSANRELKASYQPWRDQIFAENIHQNYTLQQQFLATNFRMVLVKFQTPPGFNPSVVDERSFYFAVKDWYIRGSCYCNGQSAECNTEETWKCNCLGNTTGDNCQECLPLFNNKTYKSGEACAECECYNHSSRCEYDQIKGYGVCQNCTGFTTGDNCDECLPYYFQDALPMKHPDRCKACDCHTSGITGEPESDQCDQDSGACDCKVNVTGRTCGDCKDGYWNLTEENPYGCQKCVCELKGTVGRSSVCNKKTGQCPCRERLVGLECTQCQDGYFGLTYSNPIPCADCSCSLVGSLNITCNQTTGDCYCREKFSGSKCTDFEFGYYIPGVPETTYEAEQAVPNFEYYNATFGVTGVLIDGSSDSRSVVFNVDIPKTSVYTLVVRYQTAVEWKDVTLNVDSVLTPFLPYSCNGGAQIANKSFVLMKTASASSTAVNFGDSCLVKGPYNITLQLPLLVTARGGAHLSTELLVDSLIILPSVKNFSYPKADNATLFYYEQAFSLASWSRNKDKIQEYLAPYYSSLYEGGKKCSCNDTGSSNGSFCDKDGGQCSCKPNVGGLKCDRCMSNFYNFSDTGCQDCGCDPVGSNSSLCHPLTGSCRCKKGVIGLQCTQCRMNYYGFNNGTGCLPCLCDQQYSMNLQCDNNGICPCLPGVKPPKCQECIDTSYNLTSQGCDACNCDVRGSVSLNCDKVTGNCPCKALAGGKRCDSCLMGFHYGLDEHHPTGCLKCQCSGKTANCTSKPDMYESNVTTNFDPFGNEFQGWNTTGGMNVARVWGYVSGDVALPRGIIVVTSNTDEVIYFKAPTQFLGDKRTAYQHTLSFYLREEDGGQPLDSVQGDVILKGKWFSQQLVHKFDKVPGDKFDKFSVFLGEERWKVGDANGRNVSSYEMIVVLSELEEILIRAKWSNITRATTSIAIITLRLSKKYNGSSQAPPGARMTRSVELCDCPREFIGDSCEQCAEGYTRLVPNSGPYSRNSSCVRCSCHGNSDKCDANTGVCINCKHNTTGDHCEKCATGYYGNATLGSPHPCQACSCYGGHNSCDLSAGGSFICNCGDGYEGDRCQSCASGYYGVPTQFGGRCSRCSCNSNSMECNRTTGDCSAYCQNNATGFNCELCKPEYFGDATSQNCQACNCAATGSYNNTCDRKTGVCHCYDNVNATTSCSECNTNFWGYGNETGCKECDCFSDGSTTLQCDLTTGKCGCKVNVTGMKCDRCIEGRYGVSLGCIECDCNMTYSNHSICDPRNGQCQCMRSALGGFFGGRQCTECRWDTVGTFPLCQQCNETCYKNWYHLIAAERDKVMELSGNVTSVLLTFNGTSVEGINQTLAELNTKLAESEVIFNDSHFDTKRKQDQYMQINMSLAELKEKLDKVNKSMTEIMSYLVTVIAPFDGTVSVTSTTAPALANYTTVRSWAEAVLLEVKANNRTAYQNYGNIMSIFDQIKDYNSSGEKAVEQVKQSVKYLDDVTEKINEANSILSRDFYDRVRDDGQKLDQLSKDSKKISRFVNESTLISNAANEMLNKAQGNISKARSQADSNVNRSRVVYDDSIGTREKAYKARSISAELKANSSELLTHVENAVTEVKTSIDNMTQARAILDDATTIAGEVLGMSILVKDQAISDISERVLDIEVDKALVNDTLKNATAGLKIAEEAQRLAKRAMNLSETTLEQVNEVERKIKEAHERREEARKLQNSTDDMVAYIMQITDEVENEYSEAQKIGEITLQLLNTTIDEIDKSLKCFNDSKQLALDANRLANHAYRQIINASQIHNESTTTLRNIETRLNSSHYLAMTSYRSIVGTYQNASRLYAEVKEAEDLLKTYIEQRDEMDSLKTEVTQLESQLDTLNDDLERKVQEYETCNGHS